MEESPVGGGMKYIFPRPEGEMGWGGGGDY